MQEETKAELDTLFKKKYHIAQERRKDPRVIQFESQQMYLNDFNSLQDRIIRPAMDSFGKYLEGLGHRYFIGSAQELIEGHLHPTGKITMHILLNVNVEKQVRIAPSLSFRIDEAHSICLYKNTGQSAPCCSAVGHYDLEAITKEVVENHLKDFVIETVLNS